MMFSVPAEPYEVDPDVEKVMNLLLILHADHEQNCSTSTVRLVGSSKREPLRLMAAGILALWGPLHGGANQEVIEMLEAIQKDGGDVTKYVALAKDKNSSFRLMGFGHRVYKNFDPRAKIIKAAADKVLSALGVHDPLLDIAKQLEEAALKDPYFVERKLYPNVDFYSGIIYRALGFPTNMFTVLFALGRLPGWIAHWKEMMEDSTHQDRPPAPDLHRRPRARLRAAREAPLSGGAEDLHERRTAGVYGVGAAGFGEHEGTGLCRAPGERLRRAEGEDGHLEGDREGLRRGAQEGARGDAREEVRRGHRGLRRGAQGPPRGCTRPLGAGVREAPRGQARRRAQRSA
jgi:hypothetical protein